MVTVLHVSQPTQAGVANVVLGLLADQVRRGWEVHLAAPASDDLLARARTLGVVVHRWEATRSPGPRSILEARALGRVVEQVRPDITHLHSAKAGLAGRMALRGARRTIFQPHAWSYEAVAGPVGHASAMWEAWATRWTHLTICVSKAEQDLGRRRRTLPPLSVVIPNGVDTARWTPQDRGVARARLGLDASPMVLCVGRLCRQKGQDVLLSAWPAVRAAHPTATLHLVGDGPDREAILDSLPAGVVVHGSGDAQVWMGAADVVVVPSRWEGMPLVVLEAMASARPVVATDVNGSREALGGGDLVAPEDGVGLSNQITHLLHDTTESDRQGLMNRERAVAHLALARSTSSVAAAYEDLLAAGT
ncbi:glycosyltransferase [Arsenicicoccus dermatophilus]|uniref:glycosyltransferase n=1 Tax=Arsenicicoccus dermatophilus TaxID=1076331 RepID=UPI0039173F1A